MEKIAYFIILEKSQNKENQNSADFNKTRYGRDMPQTIRNKKIGLILIFGADNE